MLSATQIVHPLSSETSSTRAGPPGERLIERLRREEAPLPSARAGPGAALVPVDAMPKPKAPSEAELLEACRAAKAAHPDFGVKRVYNHVAASKPEWRLTERRVQKVMRANKLTEKNSAGDGRRAGAGAAPGSPGPPAEIAPSLFPEDCVALARKPSQLGWVLKASGVLGGDDDDYYEDDADDERRREVPEGMARVQWLDKYEPSLEAMDALRCVDRHCSRSRSS